MKLSYLNKTALMLSVIVSIEAIAVQQVLANSNTPLKWTSAVTERIVKLPMPHLKKRLERDFSQSDLGIELTKKEEDLAYKTNTLSDLKAAVQEADGGLKTELRYQFLDEKRAYLEMVSGKNKLRKKQLSTKLRVFKQMLDGLNEKKNMGSPARQTLMKLQNEATSRFKSSLNAVDSEIFQLSDAPESKYSIKYTKNLHAIEKLSQRLQSHNMNKSPIVDGEPISKADYLRRLVSEAQAEISILDQENTILGYMARLVALDALVLSDEVQEVLVTNSDTAVVVTPALAVDFFMTN